MGYMGDEPFRIGMNDGEVHPRGIGSVDDRSVQLKVG